MSPDTGAVLVLSRVHVGAQRIHDPPAVGLEAEVGPVVGSNSAITLGMVHSPLLLVFRGPTRVYYNAQRDGNPPVKDWATADGISLRLTRTGAAWRDTKSFWAETRLWMRFRGRAVVSAANQESAGERPRRRNLPRSIAVLCGGGMAAPLRSRLGKPRTRG
jgi:hypothetical protein